MTRGDQHKPARSIAEMEREIAETRQQLGRTIEELAAKADVSARARAKASDTAARVRATFHRTQDRTASGASSSGTSAVSGETGNAPPDRALEGSGTAQGPDQDMRDQDLREQDTGTRREPRHKAAAKAGDARERAAGAAHGAAARAQAAKGRVTQDNSRTVYAVAALSLTAATVVAVVWAKQHGDLDPERMKGSSWSRSSR